jgi:hypothetical protein
LFESFHRGTKGSKPLKISSKASNEVNKFFVSAFQYLHQLPITNGGWEVCFQAVRLSQSIIFRRFASRQRKGPRPQTINV